MKLFYFELHFEGKLFETKVVVAENSWEAWKKFHTMVAMTWDAEMTETAIDRWCQVACCDAESMVFNGYPTCPAGILNSNLEGK